MARRIPRWVGLALLLGYFLYFYQLGAIGLLSKDEPRYASIGRAMARSGDWITPRLWGEPWFEKPALLYWTTAAGFRSGLGPELAPRLPVALAAVAFLIFFAWVLWRQFSCVVAGTGTFILGTCWGWVAYSQIAVTDLLLSAAFSAAMLLALPWVAKGDRRRLPATTALLGLAVLAKGFVPVVLAAPLLFRRQWRDLFRWPVIAAFLAVSLPWYVLCYIYNGAAFVKVFFWDQQAARFFSGALMHVQAVWFYLPVLALGLLPWTPLAALFAKRGIWNDPRRKFLLFWILWGFVFFSASTNKLPGYVLPLLPAIAVLMAVRLDEVGDARPWLAACAALLVAFLIAVRVLPAAIASGLSRAPLPSFEWTWLVPLAVAAGAWVLASRRLLVTALVAVCATVGVVYLKQVAAPEIDRQDSARGLWREVEPRAEETCVAGIQPAWRFGLNYYSVRPLPECAATPKPFQIRQSPGQPPHVTK